MQKVAQLYNFSHHCIMKRTIITFGGYFEDFISKLSEEEIRKIDYILVLLSNNNRIRWYYCGEEFFQKPNPQMLFLKYLAFFLP